MPRWKSYAILPPMADGRTRPLPAASSYSAYGIRTYEQDLQNISIEGRGIVDGQAEYIWRLNDPDDAFHPRQYASGAIFG
jgi:hypothetical protein